MVQFKGVNPPLKYNKNLCRGVYLIQRFFAFYRQKLQKFDFPGRVPYSCSDTFMLIAREPLSLTRKEDVMATDAPGMKGYRSRNMSGQLRDKRDDTHIGTVEKQYGVRLGARSDMHLGNFLKQHQVKSLNDLITGK